MKRNPPSISVTRARALRCDPTAAERAMWAILRRDFADLRFRRQVPLAWAIADFASHRTRVVIEIDGGQHDAKRDRERDAAIAAQGYRVVRFWNHEVLGNPDGVALRLMQVLRSSPPSNLR